MSNLPSNIDTLTDAVHSAVVTTSPSSKNSDDKELSWSNVEDTDDDIPSPHAAENPVEQPAEKPVVEEQPAEKPVVEEQPAEKPAESTFIAPTITIDESSGNDLPPLVSDESSGNDLSPLVSDESSGNDLPPLVSDESSGDDDMPQLVESSDEETTDEETPDEETTDEETTDEETTDEEMPDLVSDNDDDIVHMLIRDTNCARCRTAIQTLLNHDHDSPNRIVDDECATTLPKNEFPSIITYILWLFIALHALNLISSCCNMQSSC